MQNLRKQQYEALISKILACNNKQAIYNLFEQNPADVILFDENLINLMENEAKTNHRASEILPLVKELFIEKTITFLSTDWHFNFLLN